MKKRIFVIVLSVLLALAVTLGAERPILNVDVHRHPSLAAAQRLSRDAYDKLVDAQSANDWDMSGHAARAKDLLVQVNNEIKLAAENANEHHGK